MSFSQNPRSQKHSRRNGGRHSGRPDLSRRRMSAQRAASTSAIHGSYSGHHSGWVSTNVIAGGSGGGTVGPSQKCLFCADWFPPSVIDEHLLECSMGGGQGGSDRSYGGRVSSQLTNVSNKAKKNLSSFGAFVQDLERLQYEQGFSQVIDGTVRELRGYIERLELYKRINQPPSAEPIRDDVLDLRRASVEHSPQIPPRVSRAHEVHDSRRRSISNRSHDRRASIGSRRSSRSSASLPELESEYPHEVKESSSNRRYSNGRIGYGGLSGQGKRRSIPEHEHTHLELSHHEQSSHREPPSPHEVNHDEVPGWTQKQFFRRPDNSGQPVSEQNDGRVGAYERHERPQPRGGGRRLSRTGMTGSENNSQRGNQIVLTEEKNFSDDQMSLEQTWQLQSVESCVLCNTSVSNSLMDMNGCKHLVCRKCAQQYLKQQIANKKNASCPKLSCPGQFYEKHYKKFLSPSEQQYFVRLYVEEAMGDDITICPKCNAPFEVNPGVIEQAPKNDVTGKPLSKEAKQHYANYRFRCHAPKCRVVFCTNCSVTPYHLGLTCEIYKEIQSGSGKTCRFCDVYLTRENRTKRFKHEGEGVENVCNQSECMQRRARTCQKILKCGHLCYGVKGENKCLPCLEEKCEDKAPNHPTKDTFCTICYVECFSHAPTIQIKCGHFFHQHCVQERLRKKWPGARITFSFMRCSQCQECVDHPSLRKDLKDLKALYQKVKKKALKRLVTEGFQKDKALTNPQSKYFRKKHIFAMDKFAFYTCYECKEPYFGGMKRCEEAANPRDEQFKEKDLVCGSCSAGNDTQICKSHGTEYITFKCRFCCRVSAWYCWGNTHFCDDCHRLQENGTYLNRKDPSEHPKCPGKKRCPLGIDHPPNGIEYALGCTLCLRK